ncbi:MAG: AAA family ATPase, partial [Candidatus Helarchaeota archaeon]
MSKKCKYLREIDILGVKFFECSIQNKGVPTELVNSLCLSKKWSDCDHIFNPERSHLKGKWNEIIGLEDIKKQLVQKVQHPFILSRLKNIKIEPVKTLILFGPDGCEKISLVHALAEESHAKLEIISFKQIEELNSKIDEIKDDEPTIILINEIDLVAPPVESKQIYLATFRIQDPIISLMTAIHKIKSSNKPIVLIMVTDNPEIVSSLILKQEYISEIIYVHPPTKEDRKKILNKLLQNLPLDDKIDFDLLAKKTNNYSVHDLRKLVKIVELKWAEESYEKQRKITMKDILDALDDVVPSLTKSLIQQFELSAIRYGAMEKKFRKEKLSWDDVGGYDSIKEQLKNIESMLTSKETYEKYDVHPPKGVLLFGPPGCGKTYIARVLSDSTNANFIYASAPDLLSKWLGESEQKIRDLFVTAKMNPPTILFFDELDGIAFERSRTTDHPYLTTILSTFLSEFSDLTPEDHVLVIGSTNRIEDIDPAFLRPGRFDERIAVPPPDFQARKEIFRIHLKRVELSDDVDFDLLAEKTKNYTGAEIAYVCETTKRKKAVNAIKTGKYSKISMNDLLESIEATKPDLSLDDIEEFKDTIEKFERRGRFPPEIIKEPVSWEDIGGLKDVKKFLREHVVQPFIHHTEASKFGISPKKGIIIYGLPGTGKTSLVKAITTESNANLFKFSALEFTKIFLYRDNAPKNFRDLIRDAERLAPSIIHLENVEAIDSLEAALFIQSEIEKIRKEIPILLICETINFEGIPEILQASNQIQYVIVVYPPSYEERLEILKLKTKNMNLKENFSFKLIAEKTNLYTGSDLNKLVEEAAHIAFTRKFSNNCSDSDNKINENDFIQAMKIVEPSLTQEIVEEFKKSVQKIKKSKP